MKEVEPFCYLLNYKSIKIDGLDGNEFLENQFKNINTSSQEKMKKLLKKKKKIQVNLCSNFT